MYIEDGKGSGKLAEVDKRNRLQVGSVSNTAGQKAAENGDFYQIGAPLITLTTDSESAVLYLKNDGDSDIKITDVIIFCDTTTGGSGMVELRLYRQPTGISSSTPTVPLNTNFGSANALEATAEFGAEGSAVSGGTFVANTLVRSEERSQFPLSWILPRGTAIAITAVPPTGNTSMRIGGIINGFIED